MCRVCVSEDWGVFFVIHGLTSFLVFLGGLRPFLHHMGTLCLLYELSTPFMHWRRALIETTPKATQLIQLSTYVFGATFFVCRIVIGYSTSLWWWFRMLGLWSDGTAHSYTIFAIYLFSNIFLSGLNGFWFSQMVAVALGSRTAGTLDEDGANPALQHAAADAAKVK